MAKTDKAVWNVEGTLIMEIVSDSVLSAWRSNQTGRFVPITAFNKSLLQPAGSFQFTEEAV